MCYVAKRRTLTGRWRGGTALLHLSGHFTHFWSIVYTKPVYSAQTGGEPRSWREDVCLCINTCGENLENFTSFYKLVSLSPHMLYTCNNGMESWMGIVYLKKIKSLVVQNSPSYFENLRRISRSNWWLSKKSENPPPKINNNRPSTFTPQLHLLGSRPCLGYNDSPV